MFSAPSQNGSNLQRNATRIVVLMGPDDGSRPSLADEVTWIDPLSVQLLAGSGRLDALKCRIDFPNAVAAGALPAAILQDLDLAIVGNDRILEIRATDSDGNFTRVLGWGKLSGDSTKIDAEHQTAVVTARLDPYLFGYPLEGFPLYSPADSSAAVSGVTAGLPGDASFQVAGDLHLTFRFGMVFAVLGSTANDGRYTVVSASFNGESTTINVGEEVSDETVDGDLSWVPVAVDDKLVFNPLIDETIQGNMSSQTFATTASGAANYFLDPESILSPNASYVHTGEAASKWDMASAVNFLCQWLNPDETYIQNPTLGTLQSVFASFDSSQLRNMPIPMGKYLPEALDALLKPFGYWWYAAHGTVSANPNGQSSSTIVVFKRGTGVSRQVFIDRAGDPISLVGTNVNAFGVDRSLAQMANVVDGASGLGVFEATFPLFPAWDPSQNGIKTQKLAKDQLTGSTVDLGRKWVCNEAGDYTPRSGNFGDSGIAIATLDLTTVFGLAVSQLRRRVLKHCLSLDGPVGQGHSLGFWLEWWNPQAAGPNGTTGAWQKLAEPHAVLKREMGIWFEGFFPPLLLWNYATQGASAGAPGPGSNWPFGLRITASIESDIRIWSRGVRSAQSPNGADVITTLDLSHKFPWRALVLTGNYASQIPDTSPILYIVASSTPGASSFIVAKDLTATFVPNFQFQIVGSANNNGLYTVISSTYDSGAQQTTITVSQPVPSGIADGTIVWNADISDPLHPVSGVPITTYCQTLQLWQDAAQLSTSIVLDSVSHSEYEIGQVVAKIGGRNIRLNAKLPDDPSDDPRHPQIIGMNYLLDGQQKTELVLESFRREEFPELEDKGEGRHAQGRSVVKHVP